LRGATSSRTPSGILNRDMTVLAFGLRRSASAGCAAASSARKRSSTFGRTGHGRRARNIFFKYDLLMPSRSAKWRHDHPVARRNARNSALAIMRRQRARTGFSRL